jgi:hypothetical protein
VEKSQSGGPTKSGGGGQPTPPDSGRKVKKRKKVFPFNNLASLNWDFAKKKLLKKIKKSKNKLRQPPNRKRSKGIVYLLGYSNQTTN